VLLLSSPLARPLIEAVTRRIARRGAYVLPRLSLTGSVNVPWLQEAPEALISTPPPIDVHAFETADGLIAIEAPENTREASAVPSPRLALQQAAMRPHMERMFTFDLRWVGCQYPTPALAQDAGMALSEFADFLYGACLLDWDAEAARMRRHAEPFEGADEVRIVGNGTDLRLSLVGRAAHVDAGGANMPGGEFFSSPVEDSAEGTIAFSEYPGVYEGREVGGIRLRFEGGVVVDASAETNEPFLFEVLDRDEGARRLGELGIGCNPGITRHMKNVLFDEKIDGTVHLALGNGLPEVGGENVSQIHWDIVKDLRPGGRLEVDGRVVQEAGRWVA
jgi:aminopeptidase